MPIININAIGLDNLFELVDEALPCSFDSQNCVNFHQIIGVGFIRVNLVM